MISKVLFVLVVLLLTEAHAACSRSMLDLSLLCSSTETCSLKTIVSNLRTRSECESDSSLLLSLPAGNVNLAIDTNVDGLQVSTTGSAYANLLFNSVNISYDVVLNGKGLLSVFSDSVVEIGGELHISSNGILDVAGGLTIHGGARINGNLRLSGESSSSQQNAWLRSKSKVYLSGTITSPGAIQGTGGIDADTEFSGVTFLGEHKRENNIFFSKNLVVNHEAFLTVSGNISVEGQATVNGRFHLRGSSDYENQFTWFNSKRPMVFSGTPLQRAIITGSGEVNAEIVFGDFAGMNAGNSPNDRNSLGARNFHNARSGAPSVLFYNGNIQMGYNSFMEIEVQGSGSADFDQYIIQKNLFRDGYLYVTFLNNFFPEAYSRFNFGAHTGSTGVFHTVITDIGNDVQASYSNRSTGFVYHDQVSPNYCTCTIY